ncbi:hypothetical protein B0T26DRAFT_735672 [Lasiosphaeria miniovina]|uniref:Uncharacterized protein n=1 Tax=Lasiosphaeria miniovina TaxID=1954250 RepID=A0AA39ZR23_9PEZI|nr:uncharacterized protein B0T26DRAFT_735672 [Lasiosphaeria miniovina]KAK0702053.1 hypothetical protein B0T26DRAFT_735672 [Lasiosphaeria miniovina]
MQTFVFLVLHIVLSEKAGRTGPKREASHGAGCRLLAERGAMRGALRRYSGLTTTERKRRRQKKAIARSLTSALKSREAANCLGMTQTGIYSELLLFFMPFHCWKPRAYAARWSGERERNKKEKGSCCSAGAYR